MHHKITPEEVNKPYLNLTIKEGALFISDAHDKEDRKGFFEFLLKLDKSDNLPPQLFLMGDMFELLVGEVSYTTSLFKESIDLLNILSKKIEIFYFEGNHDFNLQKLFPNIKVFPLSLQPVLFYFKDKKFLFSHGDAYSNLSYALYSAIIRNHTTVKLLNFIDLKTKNSISKKILSLHNDKNICYKIPHFDKIIKQKIQKYDIEITEIDFICEGHHHQNKKFVFDNLTYINFSSFACDKSYFQLTFKERINFKELF